VNRPLGKLSNIGDKRAKEKTLGSQWVTWEEEGENPPVGAVLIRSRREGEARTFVHGPLRKKGKGGVRASVLV